MKMREVKSIIYNGYKPPGFRVHFDIREPPFVRGDYFPDHSEPLIETEKEAWDWARRFGDNTPESYVNIYVVDHDFVPVPGYRNKIIKPY